MEGRGARQKVTSHEGYEDISTTYRNELLGENSISFPWS